MMTPAIIETIRSELSVALPRWGMSSDATLAFLSHSENTTFLAEDPLAGQRLVLRVQRIGYHSPAEIVSELAWIVALITDEVIITPRPMEQGSASSISTTAAFPGSSTISPRP